VFYHSVFVRNTETKSKKVCQSMFLSARTHQEQEHSVSKQFEHSYILWWKHLCVAHNVKLWI
jgi:hypothetical protein